MRAAEVVVINASPDGYNINKNAGSTHPEQLQAMVKASDAMMGVAFDGDADRCLAVDEDGNMVNGDQIMGILARAKKAEGKLAHDTARRHRDEQPRTQARPEGHGHQHRADQRRRPATCWRRCCAAATRWAASSPATSSTASSPPPGDGTLTALTLCNEVMKSGKSLKQLAADFPQLPQQLVNVPNVDKTAASTNAVVQAAVEREEALLGDTGRVLLRPSGTEPLVRVMAEAATQQQADEVCARLAQVVADELAL